MIISEEREAVRNLLIVGRESALANVLSGTNSFKEAESSFSITKNIQKEDFKYEDCVVDTIGVGHTSIDTKEVLYKIVEGMRSTPEGISLVVDGKFTENIQTFDLLKKVIFKNDIFIVFFDLNCAGFLIRLRFPLGKCLSHSK